MASVNLTAALDAAFSAAEGALATIGTTVSITRTSPVTSIDLDTLVPATPTVTTLATRVNAIVAYPTPGSRQEIYPGANRAEDARWPVILPPNLTDLRRGDVITVLTSRDPRLVGRSFEIGVVIGTSAGAVRQVLCEAIPQAGQT